MPFLYTPEEASITNDVIKAQAEITGPQQLRLMDKTHDIQVAANSCNISSQPESRLPLGPQVEGNANLNLDTSEKNTEKIAQTESMPQLLTPEQIGEHYEDVREVYTR